MRTFIDFAESLRTDVRINLSGNQAFVPQKFLDASDIGTTIEQVRRKTVPQRMGEGCKALFHNPTDAAAIEWPAPNSYPKRTFRVGSGQRSPPVLEVSRDRLLGRSTDRNLTDLPTLSLDRQQVPANLVDAERGKFRDPEAGRIQRVDDRSVA